MKKSELAFSVVQVFVDWSMIIVAASLAYALRHTTSVQSIINKEGIYNLSFEAYIMLAAFFAFVIMAVYAFEGLYAVRTTDKIWREGFRIAKGTTIALMILMVGFFLQREWFSSRFVIVAAWFLMIAFVFFGRMILRFAQRYILVTRGIGRHRVLLIGGNDKLKHIHKTIHNKPALGYGIVEHLDHVNLKKIKSIQERTGLDEVIINESEFDEHILKKLYDYCEIADITYKFLPTSRQTAQFNMTFFAGEPLISLKHTPLDGWGKILKRVFDIVVSSILLLITAPIMLIAALLVKIEDPAGPMFFRNMRIGSDGREFPVYKIRYMQWKWCTGQENPDYKKAIAHEKELIKNSSVRVGPIYKIINDPRKTKVGAFLERYSIDEFPQFFNVLVGDMSIVGPRPHQEREIANYKEYHRRLLTIKPGITGMAQVAGRSDLNFEDEYRLDVYYIENWSLILDVIIMIKTVPAMLLRREN